ncbi:hypothetical protein BLNAU_23157 [Blattamonas nauphoetae]|uniref:Uncharacterized protein n=1 Tax=Blattamonas nauphoetae TaxID=2049346 RepID=A0ABQ9WU24_9EUKA|nr:hypothetical protein BLNAU_23157 [Blattamonas nauphoetae]
MGKRKASLHKRRGPQIYNSLITLVKAKYPFDDALLDRAARFLKSLEPKWGDDGYADKLVTRLVNSLARSSAGFVDSIMTLLSTPHSTMIPAALSFLRQTTTRTSSALLTDLVETGLFDNVLATVQPHTLPISGNEGIFDNLMKIIVECLTLSRPSRLTGLGKIAVVDQLNHREMIFQKVVLPSSQFLTFLISNRHVLNEDLLSSFVELLCKLPEIGPYYRPTLEYVLASPTVMALSNCLLSIENKDHLWYSLYYIHSWLEEWPKEDRKVDKSGKRVMEALFSEGLEDTLEEMMMNDKGGASRMTPTHFCGLSSDVGNGLIACADEQILGSPPIVQKCLRRVDSYWFILPVPCFGDEFSGLSEPELVVSELNSNPLKRVTTPIPLLQHAISKHTCGSDVIEKGAHLALVKAEYPFDDALQDRAVRFLKGLEPEWGDDDHGDQLVTDIVPSSGESHSEFLESILTLLSSPCSTVVAAALSFLTKIAEVSSLAIRCRLVESDLVSKVFTIVQPHTLSISGDETIIDKLIRIIISCFYLSQPWSLNLLGITAAVDQFNHREMIFQKVVIPSSLFVTFLISNRIVLNGDLFQSLISLLEKLLSIGPYHRPTLDYVLASPIAMAFSSCLSSVEECHDLWNILDNVDSSLEIWKKEVPEVAKPATRMMQVLFSEGLEDTLEQMTMINKGDFYGISVVDECHSISQLLGLNLPPRHLNFGGDRRPKHGYSDDCERHSVTTDQKTGLTREIVARGYFRDLATESDDRRATREISEETRFGVVQTAAGCSLGLLEDDCAGVPAALRSRFAVAFVHRRCVDAVPSARDAAAGLHASRPNAGHHALDVVVAGKGESVRRGDEDEHEELVDCVDCDFPNNPLFAWTEVVIAQQEVLAEALCESEGSGGTLMMELGFEAGEADGGREEEGRGEKGRVGAEEEGGEEGGSCPADSLHPAFRPHARQDAASEVLARSREEDEVGEEGEQAPLLQCDLPNSLYSVDSGKGRNEGVRNKGRRVFEHTGDADDKTPKEDAAMLDRFRKERPRTMRMGAIAPVTLVDVWHRPSRPTRATLCSLRPHPTRHPVCLPLFLTLPLLQPSLSLSTISPSSFPDLLAEHIPNTRVVDYLLTHVATLADEVKKLREERQEHLKVREEVESVMAQMEFLIELLETPNKEQPRAKTSG